MNVAPDHYTHLKLHQQHQESLERKAQAMAAMIPHQSGADRPSRYRRFLHFIIAQRRKGWDMMERPIAGYARK